MRELAARLGVRPTKTLGQNFVIDANTVRRIVRTAEVGADDHVVEVGPGLGSLTLGLLPEVAAVTAVEIDPVLAGELPATVARHAPAYADRLTVVTADALRLETLPGPPPTAARGEPAVQRLGPGAAAPARAASASLRRVLVMVQSEVADRLAAPPGSRTYGIPSVKAAWYADVRRAGAVGRTVFWPAPNVDSGLVAHDAARAAGHDREPGRGVRRRRRGVRPAPQDAAGRAGRLGRIGAGRRDGAAGGRASTRGCAARPSGSTTSPGWRRTGPTRPPRVAP